MRFGESLMDRRGFLFGGAAIGGAIASPAWAKRATYARAPQFDPADLEMYAAVEGEPFPVPAVDLRRIHPGFLRREIDFPTAELPGTVIIDPNRRYLYFVEENGRAMRYGVGVGRQGFAWNGVAEVHDKQEWPKWFPPKEMIERQPELSPYAEGMPGGPGNPLGCRAMYLWQGKKDTLYRMHGTTEPWTIGTRASSGCIRMINQDAIDLYNRVQVGAKVIVLPAPA